MLEIEHAVSQAIRDYEWSDLSLEQLIQNNLEDTLKHSGRVGVTVNEWLCSYHTGGVDFITKRHLSDAEIESFRRIEKRILKKIPETVRARTAHEW